MKHLKDISGIAIDQIQKHSSVLAERRKRILAVYKELDELMDLANKDIDDADKKRRQILHPGQAVVVRPYNETSMRNIEWKRRELKLLRPSKSLSGGRGNTRRTAISWYVVRRKNNEVPTFPPGSVGYIVSDESPFAGKPTVMRRLRINGWDGWTHVDNLDLYIHPEEDDT